jgi:hypothetical protein
MINHHKLKRGLSIPHKYHNSLIKSPNTQIYLPPSWHKLKNCFIAENSLAFLTTCELQRLLNTAKTATSDVTCWFLQNHCLHTRCIYNGLSRARLTGATTIMDDAVTIFKTPAPFSDFLHSHYAIIKHLYKLAVYFS